MSEQQGPPQVVERRTIRGASAVLLPMDPDGAIDWPAFERLLGATVVAGLTPAVNMDTGFGPYLGAPDRDRVLALTAECGAEWIAGVHSDDRPGDDFDVDALVRATEHVAQSGALPILFPSHGLAALDDDSFVAAHRSVTDRAGAVLAFELGQMFHPAGRILSGAVFDGLLEIDGVIGMKHSSLRRELEWDRLHARNRLRPGFWLMTGNDLAIDLVTVGSDYLLGLSAFAPEAFAERDRAWADGDQARFWQLNDLLQYLGQFAFRSPVPGYRHDAAMLLALRGRIACDRTHPLSVGRPDSDRAVLAEIAERLDASLV